MNKSSFKRMTKRTEFYIFIVMIALCIVIHIASSGQLLVPDKIFTILRALVVDGIFAHDIRRIRLVVPRDCGAGIFSVNHYLPEQRLV